MKKKIIIIGGGINGLCLSFAFLQSGHDVTLLSNHAIPDPMAPSSISRQIIRAQYAEHSGFCHKANGAYSEWRKIFSNLKENFFLPVGVLSVSTQEGDWTDRTVKVMRDANIPFRYIDPELMRDMLPGFNFEDIRMGVLADMGGVIRVDDFMAQLVKYLEEKGVKMLRNCQAEALDTKQAIVQTNQGEFSADWILVTAGQDKLFPEQDFRGRSYMSCFADIEPVGGDRAYWRYAPVWVDLGGEGNQWGIPRVDGSSIRIGSGALTIDLSEEETDPENMQERLMQQYGEIIHDFQSYQLREFRTVKYHGFENGAMAIKRVEQCLAIMADSGHGYKFAAQNAFTIAAAVESDTFGMASRQVAAAY